MITDEETPGGKAHNECERRPDKQVVTEQLPGPTNRPLSESQPREDGSEGAERTQSHKPETDDTEVAAPPR